MKIHHWIKKQYILLISVYVITEVMIILGYIWIVMSLEFSILYIFLYMMLLIVSNMFFMVKLLKVSNALKDIPCTISTTFKALTLPEVNDQHILYGYPLFMFKEMKGTLVFHDVLELIDIHQTFTIKKYHKTYALIQDHFDHLYLTYSQNLEKISHV